MIKKNIKNYKNDYDSSIDYENWLIDHPGSFHCKECGKRINSFLKDMDEYAWKLKKIVKGIPKNFYYCSYTCMRKAEKRENIVKDDKKAAAKLLNKYNGVLSLKECKFMEELQIILAQNKLKLTVKTREDFYDIIKKYYKQITDLFGI